MGSAVLLPQQLDGAAAGTGGKVQSHQGRRMTAAFDGLWASLPHVSQSCREASVLGHILVSRNKLLQGPAAPGLHLQQQLRMLPAHCAAVGSPLWSGILLL